MQHISPWLFLWAATNDQDWRSWNEIFQNKCRKWLSFTFTQTVKQKSAQKGPGCMKMNAFFQWISYNLQFYSTEMIYLEDIAASSLKTWWLAFLHGSMKLMCNISHSVRNLKESHKHKVDNLFYSCCTDDAVKVDTSLKNYRYLSSMKNCV